VAPHLSTAIGGMDAFELWNDGSDIPVFAWRLAKGYTNNWDLYDLSNQLRERRWLVPAYPMPDDLADLTVQRIVVRNGLSMDLADRLLDSLRASVTFLDGLSGPMPRDARRTTSFHSSPRTPLAGSRPGSHAGACVDLRISLERESQVLWRQGLRSLRPGTVLFLVGLLFSTDFLEPDVPEFLQQVLGNGVFLVIAWVGLWYPLDLLFFARLPLNREKRALKVLARIPIEVWARD
jgi:hypothetical protein